MCKLLPHMGGRRQYVLWRVRAKNVARAYDPLPPITDRQKAACGLHYGVITYTRDLPAVWKFAKP